MTDFTDPIACAAGYLLLQLFGPTAVTAGKTINDWATHIQQVSRDKLENLMRKRLKEKGVTRIRPFSKPKFAAAALQSAVFEDRTELQEVWANLLANALDPNFDENSLRTAFIDIINGLEPVDVLVLRYCYNVVFEKAKDTPVAEQPTRVFGIFQSAVITQEMAEKDLEISSEALTQSIYNLIRMSCVQFLEKVSGWNDTRGLVDLRSLPYPFHLTPLGYKFIQACIV